MLLLSGIHYVLLLNTLQSKCEVLVFQLHLGTEYSGAAGTVALTGDSLGSYVAANMSPRC